MKTTRNPPVEFHLLLCRWSCWLLMIVLSLPAVSSSQEKSSRDWLSAETVNGLIRPRLQIYIMNPPEWTAAQIDLLDSLESLLQNNWQGAVDFQLIQLSAGESLPPECFVHLPLTHQTVDASQLVLQFGLHLAEGNFVFHGKRWLRLTDHWKTLPTVSCEREELLVPYLAQQILDAYTPIVHIHRVDFDRIHGTLLGGEYQSSQARQPLIKPDDYLEVMLFYFDREGELQQRVRLDWTYLQTISGERSRWDFQVASAFRSPIPKSRRRVEIYAWKTSPTFPQTELQVLVRGDSKVAKSFTKIYLSPWQAPHQDHSAGENPSTAMELVTDRQGSIFFEAEQVRSQLGTSLIKVEILSGEAVVARVPLLLGIDRQRQILIPDDSARISALNQLQEIESRLLRYTAKKTTLIAVLQKLVDASSNIDPQPLLDQIQALPTQQQLLREVTLIQVAAVEELTQLGNRTAAKQVEVACEKTRSLVKRHWSEESMAEIRLRIGLPAAQSKSDEVTEQAE